MNYLIKYTLVTVLLIIVSSCHEEPSVIPNIYWGQVSAVKNGEPWVGLIFTRPYENKAFSIRIDVYNEQEYLREVLTISNIQFVLQRNEIDTVGLIDPILTGASYSTAVDDGDVLGDGFSVYEGESPNYIQLTEYNEDTGEVRGEFEVSFVFDEPGGTRSDPTAPDTIRFTKGRFHTRIVEPAN